MQQQFSMLAMAALALAIPLHFEPNRGASSYTTVTRRYQVVCGTGVAACSDGLTMAM
jgi:hypothetical protein